MKVTSASCRHAIGRKMVQTLPNPVNEIHFVRKNDDLRARLPAFFDLLNSAVFAKAVLAVERIVEDHDLLGLVRIVFELGQKKRERKGAAITRAQSIFEARLR